MGFGDADKADRTDAFIKERASEVAQVIKAFGAGTGLSDADREYAEGIAGGRVEMNEQALRWLVEKSTLASQRKIDKFYEVRDNVLEKDKRLETALSVMNVPQPVYESPMDRGLLAPKDRSERAKKWLEAARQAQ
jgi:hypothetical protein